MKRSSVILILVLAFNSCTKQEHTTADYEAFGKRIIRYVSTGDKEKLANLYYPEETMMRLFGNNTKAPEQKKLLIKVSLYEDFTESIWRLFSGIPAIDMAVSRSYINKGIPHVVITLRQGDWYNFIDLQLTVVNERLRVSDYYDYRYGDTQSNRFITAVLPKITGVASSAGNAFTELGEARRLMKIGNYRTAWFRLNTIEYRFQREKTFQETRLEIAGHIGDSLYAQALLDVIEMYYDEDRIRHFMKLRYFTKFREPDNALIQLDSLCAYTGESFVTRELRERLQSGQYND